MGGDAGMEGVHAVIVGRRRDNEASSDWLFMFGWLCVGEKERLRL